MKINLAAACMAIFIMSAISAKAENRYAIPASNPKIASVFENYLLKSGEKTKRKIWVFLTDKEIFDKSAFESKSAQLTSWYSEGAISRRQRRCDNGFQPDILDIPVSQRYITVLESHGLQVERSSRWLNAVSGYADANTIGFLLELEFVAEIRPVAKYYRSAALESADLFDKDAPDPEDLDISDYGLSLKQIDMLNARLMHRIGYDGIGIKIAVMDGGFKYDLPVFADIKIIDEYDFVHDDGSVSSGNWQETQHGTSVLSVMGGFLDNELIGLAYNAEFMLYETEDYNGEYVGEEDFWVAAAERADANGADIITTSVGYLDWYSYSDLDGLTAPITVAADIAFSRGIFVVASAGNERDDAWYYVTPPADGFNVLAVGAVDSLGVITNFSSAGPTYDGRIKPEVVALGRGVHCASYNGSFGPRNGTSFAAPLVAGAVALILDYYENKPVTQIRNDLLASADRADNPDNLYGYGLPDIFRASGMFKIAPIPDIAAPVGQYTFIPLDISWGFVPTVLDSPIVENMPDSALLRKTNNNNRWEIVYFGFPEDIGKYDARVIINGIFDGEPKADTAAFIFRVVERADIAFGPNPFSDSLAIFIGPSSGGIEDISIFTVSGDKVWNSFSDNYNELTRMVVWDGTNNRGHKVAPGVYLVVVRAQWGSEKFKVFKK